MAALPSGNSSGASCTGGWDRHRGRSGRMRKISPPTRLRTSDHKAHRVIPTTLPRPINFKNVRRWYRLNAASGHACNDVAQADIQPLTRQCLRHYPWISHLPQRVENMGVEITFRTIEAWHGHKSYQFTRYEAFTTHVVIGVRRAHNYSPGNYDKISSIKKAFHNACKQALHGCDVTATNSGIFTRSFS